MEKLCSRNALFAITLFSLTGFCAAQAQETIIYSGGETKAAPIVITPANNPVILSGEGTQSGGITEAGTIGNVQISGAITLTGSSVYSGITSVSGMTIAAGGSVSDATGVINSSATVTDPGSAWSNSGIVKLNSAGLSVSNGATVSASSVDMAEGIDGIYLNSGGTLATGGVTNETGYQGEFGINGGILRATADNASFIAPVVGFVNIGTNGATIDNNGHNIGLNVSLTGGDIILAGTGSTTLSYTNVRNAYIPEGTVVFSGSLFATSAQLQIDSDGTFNFAGKQGSAGSLNSDGTFLLGNSGSFSEGSDNTSTELSGTMTGNDSAFQKAGTGTFTVSGSMIQTGTASILTVAGGGLTNNGGSVGAATINIVNYFGNSATFLGSGGSTTTANTFNVASDGSFLGIATFAGQGTTLTTSDLVVGEYGNGTLNVNNLSVVTATDGVTLAQTGLSQGYINVFGGTLSTGFLDAGTGTGGHTVFVNFGTIQAMADNANFMTGFNASDVTFGTGGINIDTNGHSIGFSTAITGNGLFEKKGDGTLTLNGTVTAASAYVQQGTLIVNGSLQTGTGYLNLQGGTLLGGHGTISGRIAGGAGATVDPGNSPGILTAGQVSGDMTYNFEMTQAGPAAWSQVAASGNDVLHLTMATPFVQALTSDAVVNLFFAADNTTYEGAFFVNGADTLTAAIADATFNYYLLDNANTSGLLYNGNYYDVYTGTVDQSVIGVTNADFASGTVSGFTEQFALSNPAETPEPSTWILLAAGVGLQACIRRRLGAKAPTEHR